MEQFFPSLVVLFVFAPMVRVNCWLPIPETVPATVIINSNTDSITPGKLRRAWDSPMNYRQAPGRFRDGKFCCWSSFGPQSQTEDGDRCLRGVRLQASSQNN
jgi:hypothetical protein